MKLSRALLVSLACFCLHGEEAISGPWTDVWTMPLGGKDRSYVDYDDNSYLAIYPEDFSNPLFLDGKDVMLSAQFDRRTEGRVHFFGMPPVQVIGETHHWDGVQFGDNLWVLGRLDAKGGRIQMRVNKVLTAPSDQTLLAQRLEAIPPSDHQARLDFAIWVRQKGEAQGNRDVWMEAADRIITTVVEAKAKQASKTQEANQLLIAMRWAVDYLDDPDQAARLADAVWFRKLPPQERNRIEQYLHGLGFIFRDGSWRGQSQALEQEFEKRFEATPWHDADAFYRLAQWADEYADVLPSAPQLRHRALRAGLKADNEHSAIRRALGLPQVQRTRVVLAELSAAYTDPNTKLMVPGPADWIRHEDPIEAAASWGAQNATSFISIQVFSGGEGAEEAELPADLETWTMVATAPLTHRVAYKKLLPPEEPTLPETMHVEICSYTEGQDTRVGLLGLIMMEEYDAGIQVWANGLIKNQETLTNTFYEYLLALPKGIVSAKKQQDSAAEPAAAPADEASQASLAE
jgi:hypothetical protein